MRAVRHTAEGVEVIDVPEPEGDGVLVTPTSVGICGSDLHVMSMGPRSVTMGHEIGGTVDGRTVAIQPFPFCGSCSRCTRGDSHLCRRNAALYGLQLDGGMAEQLLVDPRCIVEVSEPADATTAALVEPIAVGVHAVNLAGLEDGQRVAVIGAGSIGLVTGAVARRAGAIVEIAARHGRQREAAERLGLRVGVGSRHDVVFDAAGTTASLTQAIEMVRPGGMVVMPGLYWDDVTIPGLTLGLKEVRLVPSMYYGHHHGRRETDQAAEVLASTPELAPALVTHRFPLARAAEAFAVAADRSAGAIKVIVEPNDHGV